MSPSNHGHQCVPEHSNKALHHSHEHTGDASHSCCSHSHGIMLSDKIEDDRGMKDLLHPLVGIIGIALGFVMHRMGYSAYRIPYFAAAVLAGYPVAKAGFRALASGSGADINLLTTIAGIGAMALGEWAEGAAVLTLFSIGEYLEDKAGERTRKSIREVMDLSPMKARIKRGDSVAEVLAEEVSPGDVVLVFPGEKIPADGKVLTGESSVNEAPITGESVPVDKIPEDTVFAGSLNGEGPLEILATKAAHDTTIARIIAMVEESQLRKAQSQRMVDNFARYWTPLMLGLSLAISIGVPLVFQKELRPWVYRGLTVLIVSCPCSLVISTPVTVVAAIARAAKKGILIKGGVHLEELGSVKALALDKTGTLTEGRLIVDEVLPQSKEPGAIESLVAAAAGVESRSEHPLAKAIAEEARARNIDFVVGESFVSVRGQGACATVVGQRIFVGSPGLFAANGIKIPDGLSISAASRKDMGKTVVFAGSETEILGMFVLSDAVRPEATEAISRLRARGIGTFMLTGDDWQTARVVASGVGIDSVEANLMPEEKLTAIAKLKEKFGSVAMAGDGVNDAPSLAEASVGIAMGEGADVALETADVALMKSDLRLVDWAIGLAKQARGLIVQNLFFSIAVKLAALVAVFAGSLPLWLAVLADSGAAVLVTFNGLRILTQWAGVK